MSGLVGEAVSVCDLVRLFTFRKGNANLVEMTLPEDSPYVGEPTGLIPWPENCALVSILRDGQVYTTAGAQPLESGDELLFVVSADVAETLERLLAPSTHGGRAAAPPAGAAFFSIGVALPISSYPIAPRAASWRGHPVILQHLTRTSRTR